MSDFLQKSLTVKLQNWYSGSKSKNKNPTSCFRSSFLFVLWKVKKATFWECDGWVGGAHFNIDLT